MAKILLVEDERVIRAEIKRILTRDGHEVTDVASVPEAEGVRRSGPRGPSGQRFQRSAASLWYAARCVPPPPAEAGPRGIARGIDGPPTPPPASLTPRLRLGHPEMAARRMLRRGNRTGRPEPVRPFTGLPAGPEAAP